MNFTRKMLIDTKLEELYDLRKYIEKRVTILEEMLEETLEDA